MADFFHIKLSELLSLLFFLETRTHTHRYEFYKMADLFHLKMFEFLFLLFSEKTHTRTDIDVIKMVDFSSLFFFLKTRTHAHIWILQNGWFVSSQNVWIFILAFFLKIRTHAHYIDVIKMVDFSSVFLVKTRTHAQIPILDNGCRCRCYKHGRFLIRIKKKKKLAHTHRYELYKMADFFHLQMSEFLSLLFWKYAHTHRYRCYKDGRFFIRIFGQNTHTRTDINFAQRMICFFISKCPT